ASRAASESARSVPGAAGEIAVARSRAIAGSATARATARSRAIANAGAAASEIAALLSDLLARAGLTVGQRVSPRRASELVCRLPVPVRGAAAMLRIVLPAVTVPDVRPVAAVDVGVPVEIVISVDGHVIVAPAGTPAPAAAPGSTH